MVSKLHRDLLTAEAGKLAYGPTCTFSRNQLRYFFGAERLGKNSWRTLYDFLPEGIETNDLLVVEHEDTVMFVKKDNVSEATDKE